ncbi:hypothetical protein LINPERHAP1_LOCUS32010 [Linum perenne]
MTWLSFEPTSETDPLGGTLTTL